MKKLASLILALTLCMALVIPAMAADDFGEVTLEYEYQFGTAHVNFTAAKMEITNFEGAVDLYHNQQKFDNAIVITVQPGSTFSTTDSTITSTSLEGTGFAVGDDGKLYHVATVPLGTLDGNVDDLFGDNKDALYTELFYDASYFKNGADNRDISLIWVSKEYFSAFDSEGNRHTLLIALDGKVKTSAPATTTEKPDETPAPAPTVTTDKPAQTTAPTTTASAAPAGSGTYTAQKYDTYGKLAVNNYGTYAVTKALQKANNYKTLKAGVAVTLPDTLGKVARIAPAVAGEGEKLYTVLAGDTLGTIAKAYFGNSAQYKAIFERNADRLKNANTIYEGQIIVLPAK